MSFHRIISKLCLGLIVVGLMVPSVGRAGKFVTCIPVVSKERRSITVETIYGTYIVEEPVLVDLLTCPQMERLKGVRQLGVWYQAIRPDNFTRFDHSVGVWALVRRFGGSLEEQVAALLHDASHTAFSHVGAFFFVDTAQNMDSFQDDIHERYLHESGLADILRRHNIAVEDIHHKDEEFKILEQSIPDICADRFEYNIQGGLWEEIITPAQARYIIEHVCCENGVWYFANLEAARMFAMLPLVMMRTIWGSPENYLTGRWLGKALRRAAQLGIITADDVRYSTDDIVWSKLCSAYDQEIQSCIPKIKNCRNYFTLNSDEYDVMMHGKFRGVDPLVKVDQSFRRLSELDEGYAKEYQRIKRLIDRGWHVMLTAVE